MEVGCGEAFVSSLAGTVKQIAVSAEDETVLVELICHDAYGAQVLADDVISRLKTDGALKLTVKVGAVLQDEA